MKRRTKALIGVGVAAVIGSVAIAGASFAERGFGGHHGLGGHHGMGFMAKGQFSLMAMEIFDSIDADGDGKITQAEIDKVRNERLGNHDRDGDGNLNLEEFAGVWHETTRPLTVRAFQILDTDGNSVITRAEYDRPLANIVERLDRNQDGGLSMSDRWRHRYGGKERDDDD
tara:strand:- start:3534 stop:4046 length:513 start_codon:yes stop_codon:yes gene_type:complete